MTWHPLTQGRHPQYGKHSRGRVDLRILLVNRLFPPAVHGIINPRSDIAEVEKLHTRRGTIRVHLLRRGGICTKPLFVGTCGQEVEDHNEDDSKDDQPADAGGKETNTTSAADWEDVLGQRLLYVGVLSESRFLEWW